MDFLTITPETELKDITIKKIGTRLNDWVHLMFYPNKFEIKCFYDRKIEKDDFIAPVNVGKFYNALLILFSEMIISDTPREKESLLLLIMKSLNNFSAIDFSQLYFKLKEKLVLEANKDWGTEN